MSEDEKIIQVVLECLEDIKAIYEDDPENLAAVQAEIDNIKNSDEYIEGRLELLCDLRKMCEDPQELMHLNEEIDICRNQLENQKRESLDTIRANSIDEIFEDLDDDD
jgi:hypothetical protein